MSKRLGNAIDPQDVVRDLGAEILRLWVSYIDFKEDMPTGHDIFDQVVDGYRRLRNTLRFMLSNLFDFEPDREAVPRAQMREVDRWALDRTARLLERLTGAYEQFEFHQVYHRVHEFCAVDLSQIYLDLLKDRLYTYPPKSQDRRSAQTALWVMARSLAVVLTPILSHTCEEVWQHLPRWEGQEKSVQLADWPDLSEWRDEELGERWRQEVVPYFEQADRAVEQLRQRKVARQPMEAELTLYCSDEMWQTLVDALGLDELAAASGVSQVTHGGPVEAAPEDAYGADGDGPMRIAGRRLEDGKCERCWRRQPSVGTDESHPGLCARCVEYLTA
jgi:isoleucyl-tRNA synthetase